MNEKKVAVGVPCESNHDKGDVYRVQMVRLKKAVKAGFYYECIFIEYAMLEDRLLSVLVHSEVKAEEVKKMSSPVKKISGIRKFVAKKYPALSQKYFPQTLLAEVETWAKKRNDLVHALVERKVTDEELKSVAEEGVDIVKEVKNKVRSFNRALARQMSAGK